jgi:arabinose-5-phosphate isomerase
MLVLPVAACPRRGRTFPETMIKGKTNMVKDPIEQAKEVLKIEAESILHLLDKIDAQFARAVEMIFLSKGRVIVTGIGKSGLIGKKIVATLTSTGTPAIFLHPVEGMHGDLGIVTRDDVLVVLSNSGETYEVNALIGNVRERKVPIIAFTGNPASTLAKSSDIVIDVGIEKEACPFGLAPTSSTTAALAMGDALAVALIQKKHFDEKDFYRFHPGGTLGLRLTARVRDVMIGGSLIPHVYSGAPAMAAVEEIDRRNLGFVLVTDRKKYLLGILTDGDVRRYVKKGVQFQTKSVDDLMTRSPKTVDENLSLGDTLETMEKLEITTLVVVNAKNQVKGYVHLHDILGRGGTVRMSVFS